MYPADIADPCTNVKGCAPHPEPNRDYIRVPNDLLGRVLDHGSASAWAAHLIAYSTHRRSTRPRHVLHEQDVRRQCGLGERRWRAANDLLSHAGIRERRRGGRQVGGRGAYAREAWAAGGRGYVMIDADLLRIRPTVPRLLGFVAAVLLERMPRCAADIARRIGLRGDRAIRRYVEAAVAGGHIAAVPDGSQCIVARPGMDLGTYGRHAPVAAPPVKKVATVAVQNVAVEKVAVEKVVVQNVVVQNVAIHRSTVDEHGLMADKHKSMQTSWGLALKPHNAEADRDVLRTSDGRLHVANGFRVELLAGLGNDESELQRQLDQAAPYVGKALRGLDLKIAVRGELAKQRGWSQRTRQGAPHATAPRVGIPRADATPPPDIRPQSLADCEWRAELRRHLRHGGRWYPDMGPPPDAPDFLRPDILAEPEFATLMATRCASASHVRVA